MIYKDIDVVVHNLGNALFSVSNLIFSKNLDEANFKLSEIFGPVNVTDFNNFIPIDLLVKSKVNLIHKYKILFSSDKLKFPKIDDVDLCIIFGNIFDNLINFSCFSRFKFISVNFYIENNVYNYIFANSFSYDECDKNSQIIKEKIGLKTIRKLIKKYNGSLNFWSIKGVFYTKLSIKNRK